MTFIITEEFEETILRTIFTELSNMPQNEFKEWKNLWGNSTNGTYELAKMITSYVIDAYKRERAYNFWKQKCGL